MIGILSLLLDIFYFNTSMFTVTYLINLLYFKKSINYFLIIIFLYISISGVVFLNVFYFTFLYYIFNYRKNNYFLSIVFSLFIYYFLFLNFHNILLSLPINILYSIFLYFVLKSKKTKYKLL